MIASYPKELETVERLRDGTVVTLRPVRPDDEPLLLDLAAHMTAEDLRFRFFTPIRRLSHAMTERLTHLDYDREMALVARHADTVLGIGRYSAGPNRGEAEFALAVRSDWKGRGVGYLLLTRLIEVARDRGIGELVGEVLHENQPMLAMARELGFTASAHPGDAGIVQVRKRLAAS